MTKPISIGEINMRVWQVSAKVCKEEFDAANEAASREGLLMSKYIRNLVLADCASKGIEVKRGSLASIREALEGAVPSKRMFPMPARQMIG
jgi:hypothetical protein